MNSECMRVLTLGIFRSSAPRLTADQAAWHTVFLELKRSGLAPEVFDQVTFKDPSGGRAFSDEIEQLLWVITSAGAAARENPVLQVIELKSDARAQFQEAYAKVGQDYSEVVSRIAEAVDERLAAG